MEKPKIRDEIKALVTDIRKHIKTERLHDALEYNEAIRNAWKYIWVTNPRKNTKKIEEIFEKYHADMSAIERQDYKTYWDLLNVLETDILKDPKNQPVLKQMGLNDEQVVKVIEKYPALETIEDEAIKKLIPQIRNFVHMVRRMIPAMILGSGSSLNKLAPVLKDWKGAIFCSSSQLDWLTYYKVRPTYVTIIDADPTQGFLIDNFDSEGIPLLTHPCIDKYILDHWKGPIFFFRMNDPGDPWFGDFLPMMFAVINEAKNWGIHSYVLNSGCVVNTNLAIAQFLGYFPIFLCGVDFGGLRFENMKLKDGQWVKDPSPPMDVNYMLSTGNNGVITHKVQIFYKYSLMVLYGLDAPQLISCSDGILSELPRADSVEVVKRQGRGFENLYRTPQEIYKVAFEYLFPRGIYILRGPDRVTINNKDSLNTLKKKWTFWKEFRKGRRHGWW